MTASPRRDVLVVCGLASEARLARGPGIRTVAGGGRSAWLAAAIEREIGNGEVAGIVSFGIAGALVPALEPGSLLIATAVISAGERLPVDAAWSDAMAVRLPIASHAVLAGGDTVVASRADKAALARESGALAVDMESHVAARAAARAALPFAALRAVADPLDRVMPPAALVAMRDGGGIDLGAVLRSIARTPSQLPGLIAVARDARRALGALDRGRRALGAGLGYPDLDQLPLDVV